MKRRFARSHRRRQAQSIDELAAMARRRLPPFIWGYVSAGAEDERTCLGPPLNLSQHASQWPMSQQPAPAAGPMYESAVQPTAGDLP